MKIEEMTNLWVVSNSKDNFTILVAASDAVDAEAAAIIYFDEAGMSSNELEVSSFGDTPNACFDCDYVVY